MLRAIATLVTTTRVTQLMVPIHARLSLTPMRCLGIVCTAILVGMMTNYGQPWVTCTKVVCGLRRSLYCKQRGIIIPKNLLMVQPTYVQHTSFITTPIVVSATQVSLLQLKQAIISIFLPWVSTILVSCLALAGTATIGRQVLTHGSVPVRTACTSTVVASTWAATAADSVLGQRHFSSPCNCPFTGVAL